MTIDKNFTLDGTCDTVDYSGYVGWHFIEFASTVQVKEEIHQWCIDHIGENNFRNNTWLLFSGNMVYSRIFLFRNEEDATVFKLKFGPWHEL